jgi:transcriptional regulator with XRE-family HTH domain
MSSRRTSFPVKSETFNELAIMPDTSLTSSIHLDTADARRRTVGALIRNAREAAGRKPKDIADFVGVSAAAMIAFEEGEKDPSLPQLEAIAYYLRVPVHTLLGASSLQQAEPLDNLEEIMRLRGHIIGARLKQARMARGESAQDIADATGISSALLQNFELGKKQPGISELELLMAHFGLTLDEMLDIGIGPLGEAQLLQQQRASFENLSQDFRAFVCDPNATQHVQLAMKLRSLSAEQLKSLANAFAILADSAPTQSTDIEASALG